MRPSCSQVFRSGGPEAALLILFGIRFRRASVYFRDPFRVARWGGPRAALNDGAFKSITTDEYIKGVKELVGSHLMVKYGSAIITNISLGMNAHTKTSPIISKTIQKNCEKISSYK